jgi:hypothetical protein
MPDRTDLLVNLFAAHLDTCREHLAAVANNEVNNPSHEYDPAFNADFDDSSRAIAKEFVDLLAAAPSVFVRLMPRGSHPA